MIRALVGPVSVIMLAGVAALGGCLPFNTLNSVSSDEGRFSASGSAEFMAVREVMNARCVVCHAQHGTYVTLSEQEWMDSGLVVAGDPEASVLYRRLKLTGLPDLSASQPASMPLGDASWTSVETEIFKEWINSL